MPVELHGRSHPAHNAARMVHYTEHRPCGCQGIKSLRVPQGGMVSKVSVSKAAIILQVLGPQGSRDPGSMVRFQGFRRSPFMDLVFRGHQRAIRLRVSRDRGFPMFSRAIKGCDVFKVQRVQGLRDEGFQGFMVQGLKGERAPKFS